MNKYGINPHPKQISGEWDYMHEYYKQILITLIRDNKKRIDQLLNESLMLVTAPAVLREIISSATTSGSRNAFATIA